MSTTILQYLGAHSGLIWPAITGVLLTIARLHTPEEWIVLGARFPRVQGLIVLLRGAGFDPAKVVAGGIQVLSGKVQLDPRDGQIAALRAQLAAAQAPKESAE